MDDATEVQVGNGKAVPAEQLIEHGAINLILVAHNKPEAPAAIVLPPNLWRAGLERARGTIGLPSCGGGTLLDSASHENWRRAYRSMRFEAVRRMDNGDPSDLVPAVRVLIFLSCHPPDPVVDVEKAIETKLARFGRVVVTWAIRPCDHGAPVFQTIVDHQYRRDLVQAWFDTKGCHPPDGGCLLALEVLH